MVMTKCNIGIKMITSDAVSVLRFVDVKWYSGKLSCNGPLRSAPYIDIKVMGPLPNIWHIKQNQR